MNLTLDPAAAEPLHRQVYSALRRAILAGDMRPGQRLPATRALAGKLSLSRATVADAYVQLQAEGYIHGRRGSGTFVVDDLPTTQNAHMPAAAPAVRLSDWGRRVTAHGAEEVEIPAPVHDLRPHRVAADLFPWDAWRTAVDRATSGSRTRLLAYPPAAGHPELRAAIASHVARYRAVPCTPEQIVVVNGTQQGLNLLAQLLLDRGELVAVEDPGYPAARLALEARGLDVHRIPVDGDGMCVDRLPGNLSLRLIHVTPSHQEPTGATLSLARRLALLDIAARAGSIILEDDFDSEFRYEGHPVESLKGLDRAGLVVYAGTFSKSVLAGLRLGFLVVPPRLVTAVITAKRLWDSGTPILEQAALAEFLLSGEFERHIRRMRRVYRARRDALVAALAEAFGSRAIVGAHHGGLNLLLSFDVGLTEGEILHRAAWTGVALRSAAQFYSVPPSLPTFLVGFGALPESGLDAAVQALAEMLRN